MDWLNRETVESHWRLFVLLFAAAAILVAVYPAIDHLTLLLYDPIRLRGFIQSSGAWGPLVIIAMQVTQVLIAFIPGHVPGLAAGYAYGVVWGTIWAGIGIAIGSLFAFYISRRWGRPAVERFADEEWLDKFDGLTAQYGYMPFFMLFLLPGFPDDTVCLLAGLTTLPIRNLLLLTVIGRLPGLIALTMAGNSIALSQTRVFIVLAVIVFIVSATGLIFRDRVLAFSKEWHEEHAHDAEDSDDGDAA